MGRIWRPEKILVGEGPSVRSRREGALAPFGFEGSGPNGGSHETVVETRGVGGGRPRRVGGGAGGWGGAGGAGGGGAGGAAGQGVGGTGTAAGPFANPAMNPYLNPYLNPYMTTAPMGRDAALLYLLAAQRAGGGIGSGVP